MYTPLTSRGGNREASLPLAQMWLTDQRGITFTHAIVL